MTQCRYAVTSCESSWKAECYCLFYACASKILPWTMSVIVEDIKIFLIQLGNPLVVYISRKANRPYIVWQNQLGNGLPKVGMQYPIWLYLYFEFWYELYVISSSINTRQLLTKKEVNFEFYSQTKSI